MTVGPWKPIRLRFYQIRIADLDIRSKVSESLTVNLTVDFTLSERSYGSASVALVHSNGTRVEEESLMRISAGHGRAEFHFSPGSLELWYPVGYGKQPLYTVQVNLTDEVSS